MARYEVAAGSWQVRMPRPSPYGLRKAAELTTVEKMEYVGRNSVQKDSRGLSWGRYGFLWRGPCGFICGRDGLMVCHRAALNKDRQADLAKYPKPQFAEAAGYTGPVDRSFIVSACLISARETSTRLMVLHVHHRRTERRIPPLYRSFVSPPHAPPIPKPA